MATRLTDREMEALVETHGNDVFKVCFVYLGRYGLADDAFQDTFLKVFEKWESFRDTSVVRAWILQIARNTCRDQLRTAWFRKRAEYEDDIGAEDGCEESSDSASLQAGLEERETEETLLRAVIGLPYRYREVLLLKAWFEMENREIANLLRITESSVRSRLKRARDRLAGMQRGGLSI